MTERALLDLEMIFNYIELGQSLNAYRWYYGLEEAIFGLDQPPSRGVVVREYRGARQILYGKKPHLYRIIYVTNRVARRVVVLHIRHGARDSELAADMD
jgi:toxin ParE1/3/4